MLQIKQLCKEYRTGDLVQKALDHVDLNLRDNEFVAILGPSGSGKTTLLNIIGGLDRYDSGNLIINGISTKKYKDRDWDSYRNHTIGFVFQSYNLIPHQTILANVELALTISGIGKSERRKKAQKALEEVGLGEQIHKKPNQLSGGQMQRVAIARALVNDPDILLADEPTGALDSATSVQVMELLKKVAEDRLVVMVTHNPELAEQYATRIVNLRDGKIRSDSDPFILETAKDELVKHKNMGKASMSFLTALSLSFHNLRTKKARTLLTAFAGSIGIIGISLILSLSTGVNDYIQNVETETLSQYPLQIQNTGFDFTSMLSMDRAEEGEESGEDEQKNKMNVIAMITNMFSTMNSNDLKSLKSYLDSGDSGIEQYTSAVEYSYDVVPQIYKEQEDGDIRQVNPDNSFAALGLGSSMSSSSVMSSMMGTDVFYEMPEDSSLYEGQYDVLAGHWPESYNECVLVLTSGGGISDFMLYTLGLRDSMELDDMIQQFIDGDNVDTPEDIGSYTYEDILGITFKLVDSEDYYEYDSDYHVWTDKSDNKTYMKKLVKKGEDIRIVGIVQPKEDANGTMLNSGIAYPTSLTKHVVENAANSEIVKKQLADRKTNVFTDEPFGETEDNGFNTDSLFQVDEKAFEDIFQFDTDSMMDGSNFDISDMFGGNSTSIDFADMLDTDKMQLKLPDMKEIDMGELIKSLDLNVSASDISTIVSNLMEGYGDYAATHPEADYSNLGEHFVQYLSTDSARSILSEHLQDILTDNNAFTVSEEDIQALFREVLTGYQSYAESKGYTDPDKFDEYLMEYLQTDACKNIIHQWGNQIIQNSGEVTISEDQLKSLATALASGYQSYAKETGAPDPSDMGTHFQNYLASEDAQNRLTSSLTALVDTDKLKKSLTESLGSSMGQMTQAYSEQIQSLMTDVITQIVDQMGNSMVQAMQQWMTQLGNSMGDMMKIDADALAGAFSMNMDFDELTDLMTSMSAARSATYENNLRTLGYADFDEPSSIEIYPLDFESKEHVVEILDDYNEQMEATGKDEQVITYTDMVGTLMSSVTDIVDIISYVLIAFVAISLVVSSIMIGVITYISVLERKKEIGILRAIGASKGNISQVFNAETFIIGLCAGLIGIGLTLIMLIPGNALIHYLAGTNNINASLSPVYAIILILLSIGLTLLGGLIPSKKAAKSDPVTALRTE